jgi:hypothetical protein
MSTTTTTTSFANAEQAGEERTVDARFETKDLMEFDESRVYGDWRDEFHKYGCVVIKNVIDKERAAYYCKKQIEWLKKFDLGFDETDPSTWTADHLPVSFKGGYVSNPAPLSRAMDRKLTEARTACTLPTDQLTRGWPGRPVPSLP